jgi:hypothetical protein
MSPQQEVLTVPKSTTPAVLNAKDVLKLSMRLYGYSTVTFTSKMQTTFKAAVAQVVGVNPVDIVITKITGSSTVGDDRRRRLTETEAMAAAAEAHSTTFVNVQISIKQATKADATAMRFFVESSNFGQLLAAEFKQVGMGFIQSSADLTVSKPSVVALNVVLKRAPASNPKLAEQHSSIRKYLLLTLGGVGLLYVLLAAKLLIDRKKKNAGDGYGSEEGAPLVGGGSKSSVAPENTGPKDQSLMMSDSNADPDVVIVDYGLDKF